MYWSGIIGLFVWLISITGMLVLAENLQNHINSDIDYKSLEAMVFGAWVTYIVFVLIECFLWLIPHVQWVP